MVDDVLLRARGLWSELAGVPVTWPADGGAVVVSSPASMLCPPGWVGIVALGDAALVTVPQDADPDAARALGGLPVAALVDPDRIRAVVPVAEVLGPASLAYCDGGTFLRSTTGSVETVPADSGDLAALLSRVPADEADESGLAALTSPAFVARNDGEIVAASGYRRWPNGAAHLSVLTAVAHRGRGLARSVASAAVADALAHGLLPQWRARPEPSRRVARALGFAELGGQLSVHLRTTAGGAA